MLEQGPANLVKKDVAMERHQAVEPVSAGTHADVGTRAGVLTQPLVAHTHMSALNAEVTLTREQSANSKGD